MAEENKNTNTGLWTKPRKIGLAAVIGALAIGGIVGGTFFANRDSGYEIPANVTEQLQSAATSSESNAEATIRSVVDTLYADGASINQIDNVLDENGPYTGLFPGNIIDADGIYVTIENNRQLNVKSGEPTLDINLTPESGEFKNRLEYFAENPGYDGEGWDNLLRTAYEDLEANQIDDVFDEELFLSNGEKVGYETFKNNVLGSLNN